MGCVRVQDQRGEQRAKRRRLLSEALSQRIKRGMIRYLDLVIDLSRAASMQDFRPSRLAVMSGGVPQTDRA